MHWDDFCAEKDAASVGRMPESSHPQGLRAGCSDVSLGVGGLPADSPSSADRQDHVSLLPVRVDVAMRVDDIVQRIRPVDDRSVLAVRDQVGEGEDVRLLPCR